MLSIPTTTFIIGSHISLEPFRELILLWTLQETLFRDHCQPMIDFC